MQNKSAYMAALPLCSNGEPKIYVGGGAITL